MKTIYYILILFQITALCLCSSKISKFIYTIGEEVAPWGDEILELSESVFNDNADETFNFGTQSVEIFKLEKTKEYEARCESRIKSTKHEHQATLPLSPCPTISISDRPIPPYKTWNALLSTLPEEQKPVPFPPLSLPPPLPLSLPPPLPLSLPPPLTLTLPPPPPPPLSHSKTSTLIPNQPTSHRKQDAIFLSTFIAKQTPVPSLYNFATEWGIEEGLSLTVFKSLVPECKSMIIPDLCDQSQALYDDQLPRMHNSRGKRPRHNLLLKKKIDSKPTTLEQVLKSRFPFSSLQETKKIIVTEKRILESRPETVILMPHPWLKDQRKSHATSYNPRSFKPTESLGIISLVAGVYACHDKSRDRLICYRKHFGISIDYGLFQIIPGLKRNHKKRTPKSCLAEQNATKEKKPKNVSDVDSSRIKTRYLDINELTEEQIRDILENEENKGGIIGKLDHYHLTIYSSKSPSLYLVFIYSGESITHLEPETPVPIKTDDILFMVPNVFTGKMIKTCLHHGLHTKVLECMNLALHSIKKLWGDFVIAKIG